jgi:hypothetical protein
MELALTVHQELEVSMALGVHRQDLAIQDGVSKSELVTHLLRQGRESGYDAAAFRLEHCRSRRDV